MLFNRTFFLDYNIHRVVKVDLSILFIGQVRTYIIFREITWR